MIFALVQDFADPLAALPAGHPRRRALELPDGAVRRDGHTTERGPTTHFRPPLEPREGDPAGAGYISSAREG